jgi:hypothetical protein
MLATPHLQDAELDSYLHKRLDSATASSIQSHVRQCDTCEQKLVSLMLARLAELRDKQPDDSPRDRRIGQRLKRGDYGCLQSLCPLSFEQLGVQILDVSATGFGLIATSFLQSGTIVQVMAGTTTTLGEVLYCRNLEGGKFHLGIRLRTARKVKRP